MDLTVARTDRNKNPAAFTVDMAKQAGLIEGVDYEQGDPFQDGASTYYTAKLLGDPIHLTCKLIDALGFYTKHGGQRWVYISMPKFVWNSLSSDLKRDVVGFCYRHEGGTAMVSLFPNYNAN